MTDYIMYGNACAWFGSMLIVSAVAYIYPHPVYIVLGLILAAQIYLGSLIVLNRVSTTTVYPFS